MQKLRNKLMAGGAVVILAAIGTVMNSHPALGQGVGGPTVTINASQLPLPVTGTLGVTGTPNVKVTNTITAPVPVLDISHSASQHVHLNCNSVGSGNICFNQSGAFLTPYVVPAGQNLVLTSVDIIAFSPNAFSLFLTSSFFRAGSWEVPADGLTHSFQYPGGIVLPAGFTFSAPNLLMSAGQQGEIVDLEGFLTPN